MSTNAPATTSTSSHPSILQRLDNLSTSPIPSAVLSLALLLKALVKSRPLPAVPNSGTSGSSYALQQSLSLAKPTRTTCAFFGGALALGTYMMYDGDPLNAAGFNFAWSSLYLIVNGKSAILSFFKARFTPAGLTGLALLNAGIYGKEFFWSKRSPFQN